ncbi:hypothetical protein DJ533_11225 [Acinetobacter defluvii]|uniref:Internalin n=1 Tax=Acinetobacter defluvii TaxID=1871111 RepID=A0A2S2FDV5_9GAMM|nr:hypothetical protein [Acinetobacter defluvii]AWL29098.1 hypothetical protein DJ533_11225 [Acinetobacter defluvii]
MKLNLALAVLLIAPLTLVACSKQEKAPAAEQGTASEAVATDTASETVTAEQQAAIDALDQPVLDEKNTDVPAEKANAPADAATPATEEEAAAH